MTSTKDIDSNNNDNDLVALITPVTNDNIDILTKILTKIALLNKGPCEQCGEPLPNTTCFKCNMVICESCTNPDTVPPYLTCRKCSIIVRSND